MEIFDSLNQFEDNKFFESINMGNLNKDDKDKKKDSKDNAEKKPNPEKEKQMKLAQEDAKDAANVVKKAGDNFKRFEVATGGKIEKWIEFFNSQKALRDKLGAKGINTYYKMFDSPYVVILWPKGNKAYLVVIDSKNPQEPVFKTTDKAGIKNFKNFYMAMMKRFIQTKEDFINAQEQQKAEIENAKKEEERKAKREKLGSFLKESGYKKKRFR